MKAHSNTLENLVGSGLRIDVKAYAPRSELDIKEATLLNYDEIGISLKGKRLWKGQLSQESTYFIPYSSVSHLVLPDEMKIEANPLEENHKVEYDTELRILSFRGRRVVLAGGQCEYLELFLEKGTGEFVETKKLDDLTLKLNPQNRTIQASRRMRIKVINTKLLPLGLRIINSPTKGYCLSIIAV